MNVFKEMALSVYSFQSYKEFLKNRKSKVFGFAVLLMLIYFVITILAPFVVSQLGSENIKEVFEEGIPDFELSDGYLWVDDVIEFEQDDKYVYIDTDPQYFFYSAEEMKPYLYDYSTVILMDSEKMIAKSNGQVQELYFSDIDFELSKEDVMGWIPFIYVGVAVVMVFMFIWMTALFFFGVLFVALIGMIVASCMKYQLTFGQLYLLGVYSRTLPLIIKAAVSFLPFDIPFFFVINFGLSLLIIGCAIQKMKEQQLQQPLQFTSDNSGNNDFTWMK
ncbi:MAG: DUF1189 domain-containing protein [Lachnospiraceae bacterium]|nr:DUF1189 domain-containing protein [Lachnospiraceae bacterium]